MDAQPAKGTRVVISNPIIGLARYRGFKGEVLGPVKHHDRLTMIQIANGFQIAVPFRELERIEP